MAKGNDRVFVTLINTVFSKFGAPSTEIVSLSLLLTRSIA